MDPSSHSNSNVPAPQISPEEDARLLAIEALEARSVDPHPRPLNADTADIRRVAPRPTKVATPAPQQTPSPAPVIKKAAEPEPAPVKPVEIKKPQPVSPAPAPPPKPAPVVPKKPATPAEAMAEALANAPSPTRFPFFAHQKAPRKPFIIIGIIALLIGIGAIAYFTTQ